MRLLSSVEDCVPAHNVLGVLQAPYELKRSQHESQQSRGSNVIPRRARPGLASPMPHNSSRLNGPASRQAQQEPARLPALA
jgi:hypothetical protein